MSNQYLITEELLTALMRTARCGAAEYAAKEWSGVMADLMKSEAEQAKAILDAGPVQADMADEEMWKIFNHFEPETCEDAWKYAWQYTREQFKPRDMSDEAMMKACAESEPQTYEYGEGWCHCWQYLRGDK